MGALVAIFVLISAGIGAGAAILSNQPNPQQPAQLPDLHTQPALRGRIQITVRVVDKRIKTVNSPNNPGAEFSYTAAHENIYYMTFEAQDGTLAEMEIPEAVFCGIVAGFVGTLTYEKTDSGLRFIDFVRDMKYRINGI